MSTPLATTVAFGDVLRRERQRIGLSQEMLAERAGLDRTEVGKIERGRREPRLATIIKLCRALDVDPNTLISELLAIDP